LAPRDPTPSAAPAPRLLAARAALTLLRRDANPDRLHRAPPGPYARLLLLAARAALTMLRRDANPDRLHRAPPVTYARRLLLAARTAMTLVRPGLHRATPATSLSLVARSAAIGLLLLATPAAASPTVILLRTPDDRGPWRAAESRTRDELRLMGLRVEEVRAPAAAADRLLDELGADAVIRIERTPDGARAEVWIADPPADPRRLRIDALARTGSDAAAVAALRTAELVHAGISAPVLETSQEGISVHVPQDISADSQPIPAGPEPPLAPPVLPPDPTYPPVSSDTNIITTRPAPPPAAPSPFTAPEPAMKPALGDAELPDDIPAPSPAPPRRPSRLRGLGVHLGVLGGPGGARPLVDLTLTVRVQLARLLSFEPAVWTAVTPVQARFAAGQVRLGLAAAQAALVLTPGRQDAIVAARLALGGGVALAWARGQASEPLDARTDLAAVAVLHASAGLAIRVRPRLRLRLDLGTDILLPPVAVRITGDEVARLGSPLIRGALGLEWQWPRR